MTVVACDRVRARVSQPGALSDGYRMQPDLTEETRWMGRHSEEEPAKRRRGGLRWKGDTTDSIPVIPAEWETHEGITDSSVDAFVASVRTGRPPGMDVDPNQALYAWMIERCSNRDVAGQPIRLNAWIRIDSGYCAIPYADNRTAAVDMLDRWFLWNGVTKAETRKIHTMWVHHATEAEWVTRLDGR